MAGPGDIKFTPVDVHRATTNIVTGASIVKGLQDLLTTLMAKAGIKDPSWMQFKMPDGSMLNYQDIVQLVRTNKLDVLTTMVFRLKHLVRDTNFLNTIIPAAGENNMKMSKGERNPNVFQKITIDLSEPGISKGSAPQQAPTQVAAVPRTKTVGEVTAGEGETRVYYKDEWLAGKLREWGFYEG